MTLDEAIKKGNCYLKDPCSITQTEFLTIFKLGIEALKEVKMARRGDPALDGELLPGETEN